MKKKAKVVPQHELLFNFKALKEVNNEIIIEGYANPTTVDRGREIMPMDCWQLDNFRKTGVILFNHDRDEPIGKPIEVRATPEGLYLKARISKSKHPDIVKIRDMIREQILNAFSVGFMELDHYMTPEGVKVITQADLFEVSVVTVPMNQDASFTIAQKSLSITHKELEKLPYDEIAARVLLYKGAVEAVKARAKAHELGFTTEQLVKKLALDFNIKRKEAWDIMSGNRAINKVEKKAIADILAGKKKKPKPEGEEAVDPAASGEEAPKFGKKPSAAGKKPVEGEVKPEVDAANPFAKENDEEGEKPSETPVPGATDDISQMESSVLKKHSLPVPSVHAVLVPLSTAPTAEEAKAVALAYGMTGIEEPIEEADGWIIIVRAEEDFMGELATMTIGDGVLGLIGVLAPEHSSKNDTGEAGPGEQGSENLPVKDETDDDIQEDDADTEPKVGPEAEASVEVAADGSEDEISEEQKDDGQEQKPKKGQVKKHFDLEVSKVESNDDPAYRPRWAYNAKAWEKAKAASLAELGLLSYAFIVSQYSRTKTAVGVKTKGGAIEGYGGPDLDVNPIQESSKQTHILLGAMIAELQGLRQDVREQTTALQSPKASTQPELQIEAPSMPEETFDPETLKSMEKLHRLQNERLVLQMKLLGIDLKV